MVSVDVFSPEGLFSSSYRSLRVTSIYLLYTNRPPYRSITPDRMFTTLPSPHLIIGDFNFHHPLADPLRALSDTEFTLSACYLDVSFDAPYHLLNTPGVYTRFPFDFISRPSVLNLAFANNTLSPFVSS